MVTQCVFVVFLFVFCDQLKKEVAEVQQVLDELKATNANSEEIMAGICGTWVEHLQTVIDKLNALFRT